MTTSVPGGTAGPAPAADLGLLLELLGRDAAERMSISSMVDGEFRPMLAPVSAAGVIAQVFAERDCWFSAQPLHQTRVFTGRGRAVDVVGWRDLYADLDVKIGGMPTWESARAVIDDLSQMLGTAPTAVVHSGHGLQPHWAIERGPDTDWSDETDPRWADAAALLRRWGRLVAVVAGSRGGAVDSVYDLARVLRAPATTNRKSEAAPVPTVMTVTGGSPISITQIRDTLDAYDVPEWDDDRPVLGEVTSPADVWSWAEGTCAYATAMIAGWRSDTSTARHPWLVNQAVRLAAAHRLGCLTERDHTNAVTVLTARFRELLTTATPRAESAGEIDDALTWGIARTETRTDTQARAELADHQHKQTTQAQQRREAADYTLAADGTVQDRDKRLVARIGPTFSTESGAGADADADDASAGENGGPGEDATDERSRTMVETAPPDDPAAVARQLVDAAMRHSDGTLTFRSWRGSFYHWQGARWVPQSDDKMRAALWTAMADAFYLNPRLRLFEAWKPNRRRIGDLLEALASQLFLDDVLDAPAWIGGVDHGAVVSMANGNLRLSDRRMTPHTPQLFNLTALPYDYDPSAPTPRRWMQFLDELWPEDPDSIALLREWCGYVLSGRTDLHKIMLLVGPPRGGKGTIARVLTALIGASNHAAPTLTSLGGTFGLETLIGISLAIIGDVRLGGRDTHIITERLLTISGEDSVSVDRKYARAWTGRLGIRFLLMSNELPKLGDASGALATRFSVLQLVHSFADAPDLDLGHALLAELPGILLWALAGQDALVAQRRFTVPASARQAMEDLADLASPIRQFVAERCLLGPSHEVSVDVLYDQWRAWSFAQGAEHITNKATFGKDLKAAHPRIERRYPRDGNAFRRYVYSGIRLDPDLQPLPIRLGP